MDLKEVMEEAEGRPLEKCILAEGRAAKAEAKAECLL